MGLLAAENVVDLMLERERDPELIGARMPRVGEQVEAQVLVMRAAMLGGRGSGWQWPGPGACRPGRQDPGPGGGGRAGLEEPEEGDLLGRPGGREDREAVKSSRWVSTHSTPASWGQSSSSSLQYTILANTPIRRNFSSPVTLSASPKKTTTLP